MKENWSKIIGSVKTPLGFYTLTCLLLASILLATINKFEISNLVITLLAISVVVLFAIQIVFVALKYDSTTKVDKEKVKSNYKFIFDTHTSNNEMIEDLNNYKEISFLGIVQDQLADYLDEVIKNQKEELPWETISIFFASEDDGEIWNHDEFNDLVKKSRFEISSVLTTRSYAKTLQNLKEFNFYRCRHHTTFGGCSLTNSKKKNENTKKYIELYLPALEKQRRNKITLKMWSMDQVEDNLLLNKYNSAFNTIRNDAKILGKFEKNLWNYSVDQWSNFVNNCEAYKESMNYLISLADIKETDKILDIGAGSGDLTKLITNNVQGSITMLDSSPQMLIGAKKNMKNLTSSINVNYVLCDFPIDEHNNICDFELKDKKFDKIIVHLSLFPPLLNNDNLNFICNWCYKHLNDNGLIIFTLHNTCVEIDENNIYVDREKQNLKELYPIDSFYESINSAECHERFKEFYRFNTNNYVKFKQSDVFNVFKQNKFELITVEESNDFSTAIKGYDFSMKDRLNMWKVPAILNTKFEVEKFGIEKCKDIIDFVKKEIEHEKTKPLVVVYWKFKKL